MMVAAPKSSRVAGSVLAWVFECYEHGVLTKEDLDGIEAVWGSGEAMVALMQKVYDDEGCGKKIKLGQKGAADAFGKGHEYLAVANGVELGCHDSRIPGNGARIRVYQYDPTPGRHTKGGARGRFDTDEAQGKADIAGAFGTEIWALTDDKLPVWRYNIEKPELVTPPTAQ